MRIEYHWKQITLQEYANNSEIIDSGYPGKQYLNICIVIVFQHPRDIVINTIEKVRKADCEHVIMSSPG